VTVQGVYAQDVRQWQRELLAAGWKQIHMTLWQAPCGCFFRGPYRAWMEMKGTHLADHIAAGLPETASAGEPHDTEA
jgi:hypothetical protein